ncbi:MAG: hypothetical protein WD533_03545 [Dehalococcoidia bacterium]
MTEPNDETDHRIPIERLKDRDRMLAEMQAAVQEALIRHKRLGNPIAVWRNNRVEWIPPEEIPV